MAGSGLGSKGGASAELGWLAPRTLMPTWHGSIRVGAIIGGTTEVGSGSFHDDDAKGKVRVH